MGLFDNLAWQVTQRAASRLRIPADISRNLPIARRLFGGDFQGGIEQAIRERFGFARGLGSFGEGWAPPGSATKLVGGITVKQAKEIFDLCRATDYAKKNLWALSVFDLKEQQGFGGERINLFATDVQHSQFAINGDSVSLGSGHFDVPRNGQPVEVRITTLDDSAGSIKNWFRERHQRAMRPDGTHGLPVDYLMVCEIVHAFIDVEAGQQGAYVDRILCRAGSIETDLSRRDDNLQELQITLVEHDSFIPT